MLKIKMGSRITVKRIIVDYIFFLVGSALFSFAFAFFIYPNNISPGGLTGIASIINYTLLLPTGAVLFFINIPVLLLGFRKKGGVFLIKTVFVTAITSVLIDVFIYILPKFNGDRFLAAIFGGALAGFGLALVMLRGGTTGGVDVIAVILKEKFPFLSIGRLVLILDCVVIALAAICYKEIESALFAVISIFISGKVLDTMLYGADKGRLIFIVTNKEKEVSKVIFEQINRGVTILPSYGGFNMEKNKTLICAVRFNEVDLAIKAVRSVDEKSFTVVTIAGGIFGLGFEIK